MGVRIEVRNREPIEKALRRLKRACEQEGTRRDLSATEFYESPSERRRRKAHKAAGARARMEAKESRQAERHRGRTARKKLCQKVGAAALPSGRGAAGGAGAPGCPKTEARR